MSSTHKFFVNRPTDDEIIEIYCKEFFGNRIHWTLLPKDINILWTSEKEGRFLRPWPFHGKVSGVSIYDFCYYNYMFFIQWDSNPEPRKEPTCNNGSPRGDWNQSPEHHHSI